MSLATMSIVPAAPPARQMTSATGDRRGGPAHVEQRVRRRVEQGGGRVLAGAAAADAAPAHEGQHPVERGRVRRRGGAGHAAGTGGVEGAPADEVAHRVRLPVHDHGVGRRAGGAGQPLEGQQHRARAQVRGPRLVGHRGEARRSEVPLLVGRRLVAALEELDARVLVGHDGERAGGLERLRRQGDGGLPALEARGVAHATEQEAGHGAKHDREQHEREDGLDEGEPSSAVLRARRSRARRRQGRRPGPRERRVAAMGEQIGSPPPGPETRHPVGCVPQPPPLIRSRRVRRCASTASSSAKA